MMNQPLNTLIKKAGGCRYMLVTAVAKRARQLQNEPDVLAGRKPVTAAVEELYSDELVIEPPKEYYQSQN